MDQIPDSWTNPREEDRRLYEMASSGGVPNVAPSMLGTIVKVMRQNGNKRFSISLLMQDDDTLSRYLKILTPASCCLVSLMLRVSRVEC